MLINISGNSQPEIFYGRCGYLTAMLTNRLRLMWQRDFCVSGNACSFLQGLGDCNNDGHLEIGGVYLNVVTNTYEFRIYQAATGMDYVNSATLSQTAAMDEADPAGNEVVETALSHEESVIRLNVLIDGLEREYLNYLNRDSGMEPSQNTGRIPAFLGNSGQPVANSQFSLNGYGTPCTDMVSADLDGDGCDEFLFGGGCSLYCLKPQGCLWSVNTGGVPGEIALADADWDGNLEIIVGTSDGYVKVFQ